MAERVVFNELPLRTRFALRETVQNHNTLTNSGIVWPASRDLTGLPRSSREQNRGRACIG